MIATEGETKQIGKAQEEKVLHMGLRERKWRRRQRMKGKGELQKKDSK